MELPKRLETRGAWFATTQRFRGFENVVRSSKKFDRRSSVKVSSGGDKLAGLRLRIHKPRGSNQFAECADNQPTGYVDISLNERIDTLVAL